MISIVVTGRNDDYGDAFAQRLFRCVAHNLAQLTAVGLETELILVEWNPLPDRPLLSHDVVSRWPQARAFVVSPELHEQFNLNPSMAFHEMPAKNVGVRRADGDWILVTNADVLLDDRLVGEIVGGSLRDDTLYRAHRLDIAADVPWSERDLVCHHRPSGEGRHPPPYYLGAGGDFCLASKALWHRLAGFDERVRFSTRAKDWQFFLSAAAHGVPIAFLGCVYHLAHASGFQHAPEKRDSPGAHFGGAWDIEYGLPVSNDEDWGLAKSVVRRHASQDRVAHLEPAGDAHGPGDDGHRLRALLTPGVDQTDSTTATLVHGAWLAATRGLPFVCDLHDPWRRARYAGVAGVAAAFGVPVGVTEPLPVFPGHTHLAFPLWPRARIREALIVDDSEDTVAVRTGSTRDTVPVGPCRRPPAAPRFNPMLAHRLLRAWLRMRVLGVQRVVVFGAGSHTEALLRWGLPDDFELVAVVESTARASQAFGLPLRSLASVDPATADAILLSSVSYEPDMLELARTRGWQHVIPLYLDWPPDFWSTCLGGTAIVTDDSGGAAQRSPAAARRGAR